MARRPVAVTITGESANEAYVTATPVLRTMFTDLGTDVFPDDVNKQYTVPGKLFVAVNATDTEAFDEVARTTRAVIFGMGGTMLMVGLELGRCVGCLVIPSNNVCEVGRRVGCPVGRVGFEVGWRVGWRDGCVDGCRVGCNR